MSTQYPLTPGTLASTCYPASAQTLYNEMFQKAFVTLPIQGVVVSSSTPATTDRDKIWFKLDGSSQPVGWFKFQGGLWLRPHDIPSASSFRTLWAGTEAAVWAIDGGDGTDPSATTPTSTTGAMWEVDHDFDFRTLIGPGTSSGGTTINVGDTGGVEEYNLTEAQLPEHTHVFSTGMITDTINTSNIHPDWPRLSSIGFFGGGTTDDEAFTYNTTSVGSGDEVNNMPPYKGIFVIKRTARQFYRG